VSPPTPTLTSTLIQEGGGEWDSSAAALPTPRRPAALGRVPPRDWPPGSAGAHRAALMPCRCLDLPSLPAAGFISPKELSKALANYGGFTATDKEVEQVISEATHNADRRISYDVFKRVMMSH
jgi:hypothetical protein